MLNKIRIVENITSHYVATLGLYRFFYILNWIYRWRTEKFYCWTQILSGSLQTGLYVDFLYWYYVSLKEGKSVIELPIWDIKNVLKTRLNEQINKNKIINLFLYFNISHYYVQFKFNYQKQNEMES